MPINDNKLAVAGGTIVPSYAAGGYVTNGYIYNVNTAATTYPIEGTTVNYGSSMDTELIEALFTLKPKLRKKYRGDKAAFRKDVLAAAKSQEQVKAVEKLSDLLAIEV